jgi:hypothetical protein
MNGTSEPEISYSPHSPGPATSDHQNAHTTGEPGSGGSSPIVTSADGSTSKIAANMHGNLGLHLLKRAERGDM